MSEHRHAANWRFLPEADVEKGPPSGFCQVISDSWWIVCPERGLLFFAVKGDKGLGAPQCNKDEAITAQFLLAWGVPAFVVKHIPRVLVPIRLEDYL